MSEVPTNNQDHAPQSTEPAIAPAVLRVIDANANRAAEGLRVVEDYLRFVREDRFLAEQTKQLRHDLALAIQSIPSRQRHGCRSTTTDVGIQIKTDDEFRRETVVQVVSANLRRAAEAFRVIEEFAKLDVACATFLAQTAEQLRYRLYTLEKSVSAACFADVVLDGRLLYVLVDTQCSRDEFRRRVELVVTGGGDIIQLRDKRADDRRLLLYARELRCITRDASRLMIVNDRPDIAVLADADGVHVGQDELQVADVRAIVGAHRLIGVSTHSLPQTQQAVWEGADYLGVGPVFPSATKSFDTFPGIEFARQAVQEHSLPVFAIGGISLQNVDTLTGEGISRVAVSAAIWHSADMLHATQQFKQSLANRCVGRGKQ